MRIQKLNSDTKKNLLEDLLKRSPNNYGQYEASVKEILDKVKEEKYNFNKKSAVETYEKLLNLIVRAPDREYFEKEMLKNYYNQVALAVDYAKKVFGPEFPPY